MRLLAPSEDKAAPPEPTEAGLRFDPFATDYVANPYPQLAELQRSEPVFYAPSIESWVVTRFATVRSVLADTKRFSAKIASDPLTPLCPHAREMIAQSEFDVPGLLVNNDPPQHTGCRKFFGEPLKPHRLSQLRPFIASTVDSYIDRMIEAGPPADLAKELTWDVPALVLFRLLGVPDEDVAKVKDYADSRVILLWGRPTEADQIRLTEGAISFFKYTKALVHSRLEFPRDDYPSQLIRARDGDDSIATIRDIVAVTFNLLFAGHETTSSAAANILHRLLSNPSLWQSVVDGTADVQRLIDEGLRYDPPVQAWRRRAIEDVVLDGVAIPAGSHLLLHFAAANRDPAKFGEPATFDPARRDAAQHVSFGAGAHFCLGAALAKLEISTMLERLAVRMPGLRALPHQNPEYLPNTSFRGLRNLAVTW